MHSMLLKCSLKDGVYPEILYNLIYNRTKKTDCYQHNIKYVRLFLDGAVKIVHTALWPHYPNKNILSDRRNRLYGKSASLRCGVKLFHSPGPAAAKALSPKVLWVWVTTHVRLHRERSRRSRASATRRQSSVCSHYSYDCKLNSLLEQHVSIVTM